MKENKRRKKIIRSEEEMNELAGKLARRILGRKQGKKGAVLITLRGELGSGKTTFARAWMRAAGSRAIITSPTFVLIKKYKLPRGSNFEQVYHADAYRLKKKNDLIGLGWKEIANNPKNIILLEWPERVRGLAVGEVIRCEFKHGKKEGEREVIIRDRVSR